ncbi:helix-turn-helix domain-containing protein [Microvirga sp. ACRRW]|uniref:helix-turn-helix domain-containing protein n=1 Tax=Microvirga sp. ACRRW TaxID=2918205 RepID=UPI001EF5DFD3|nr:helix-turn-helix transcriptional regulator [Microvirga sp. ACRRW]MCG7394265.1 helix-turn-helix domain-containing protein [Microvirga sp. ACRRW]
MADNSNVSPHRALLGRNVKALRTMRGLGQESLAMQLGMSRAYLSSIERGEKAATIDTIARLAEGLDVTIARLLEEVPTDEKGKRKGKN